MSIVVDKFVHPQVYIFLLLQLVASVEFLYFYSGFLAFEGELLFRLVSVDVDAALDIFLAFGLLRLLWLGRGLWIILLMLKGSELHAALLD